MPKHTCVEPVTRPTTSIRPTLYESRARALACLGELDQAREAYRRAGAVKIADEQDRAIVETDLASGPWYGLNG